MGLLSKKESSRIKAARRIADDKGLILHSAEAPRYYGTERPLPKSPIDERAAEASKLATGALTRVELSDEIADTWSCFEEKQPDGSVTGRIWVRREPTEKEG